MPQAGPSSIAQRPALNSFALYLMSLAAMIGMYSVYAKFLVPIIEGPQNVVVRRPAPPNVELTDTKFNRDELVPLLPGDAWENGDCKTLVTSQGTILFQHFERIEGGYLEVLPFTLLTSTDSKKDTFDKWGNPITPNETQPTVLRCLKGARLKFDNPGVDPLSGKSKLESAWLVGDVNIVRSASSPSADDAIEISTSNVQIDKQKVFTIDPVDFRVGNHHGSGKNLSIDFAHADDTNKITSGFSTVRGIKRMELAFLDRLNLETSAGGTKKELVTGAADSGSSNSAETKIPITVTCKGPFVFDFDQRTAVFRDAVQVDVENEFQDNIQCERLTILFDEKNGLPTDVPNGAEGFNSNTSNWELRKLVAEGLPATIFSVGREAKVTGDWVSFDVSTGEVLAERRQSSHSPVTIISPEFQVTANRVAYEMPSEAGIGPIDAQGPGSLLRVATEKSEELFVEWQNGLTVLPDQSQRLISMDGGCKIRLDEQTKISAQKIRIWLNEVAVEKAAADGSRKKVTEFQPDHLIAEQDVEILSEQLNGVTQKLTATWQLSDIPLQTRLAIPHQRLEQLAARALKTMMTRSLRPTYQRQGPEPDLNEVEDPPQRNGRSQSLADILPLPVRRTTFGAESSNQTFTAAPLNRDNRVAPVGFDEEISMGKKKFSFRGNEVNVQLLFDGTVTEIQDLTATGEVSIAEIATAFSESDTPPLTVKGNFLRCVPQADEQVRILVTGTPGQMAAVSAERLKMEGQQIHLDQAANKLWIEGAGIIRLENPPAAKNQPVPGVPAASASSTANYDQVTVAWSSGMVFDGNKVYFEDDVKMEARGKNSEQQTVVTSAASEGMSLQLKQAVNFRDLESDGQKNSIDIREVILVDRVASSQRIFQRAKSSPTDLAGAKRSPSVILNQTFDSNDDLIEQQKFLASQITLNAASGAVTSKGPGIMMMYRRGGGQLLAGKSPKANPTPTDPNLITFVRVNFDGSADANTNDKQMLIRGNVRTLYSVVNSFEQILDPDNSQPLGADGAKITCDQLKLVQWTPRNADASSNELLATGNAHVVGGTFEATADRVSYSQSTDLLVVEGTPRSDANLWFKQTPNSVERDHLVAGKILYRLSDQWAEVQSVKNMNINRK